jgi:hypothetical protein
MKYCLSCGSEFQDSVVTCSDCSGKPALVGEVEARRRGLLSSPEMDTRKFVPAGTAEDPLSSEQLVAALTAAKIPVYARPRRSGAVDGLTSGSSMPWWELLVPESDQPRAARLISEEKARVESNADEAGRAAEEEEAEGEASAKKP